MAIHEHFRQYTKIEIEEIKRQVCVKHRCPYLGRLAGEATGKRNENDASTCNKSCNYMLYTGKMRGCMPDECTHYSDDINLVKELRKKTKAILRGEEK